MTRDAPDQPLRLHIGGKKPAAGWKLLDIRAVPGVDFVGDCRNLSEFADESVDEVYASHVYEHLGYVNELPDAFRELHRILKPGGVARISVPDIETLCRLFLQYESDGNARFVLMRMMFGGQMHPHDFHRTGLNWQFMLHLLSQAGFTQWERVAEFGLFEDASSLRFNGELISLNVIAKK